MHEASDMEAFKYSDLLQHLDGFDAWLTKLGLTLRPNDRIHQAVQVLGRAEEASRRGQETGEYTEIQPRDWFPVIEALEAHDVFMAFRDDPSPAIGTALKRALSGPLQPSNENHKNRDGRNIWFELALAAEWKLRGASVSLDEPNLRLTRDGITILVACKRPATTETIEANLRDAVNQLQRNLDSSASGTFGVAAISLSCAFNPGDKVFAGEMQGLRTLLESVLDQHRPYFRSVDDSRVCCILFHITTPALGEDVDLLRASFTAVQELHPSIGSKTFRQHGEAMRSNARRR
jgi:hypothetical protein